MKKSIMSALLVMTLFFMQAEVFAGVMDFGISPSRVRLSGPSGESREFTITLVNKGDEPLRVNVELNDFLNEKDDEGRLQRIYVPAGTTDMSLAKWITYSDEEIRVEAGMSVDIPFLISVPGDVDGLLYSVAFFTAEAIVDADGVDASKAQSVVSIQPRLGSLIFYEVEGSINREGRLVDLAYTIPDEDNPLTIKYELENTGNADIFLSGNFYILDENNVLAAKEKLQPVRLFPGDTGFSETSWPGYLDPGKYHMVVNIELGPNATEVILREYDFEVEEY